MARIDSVICNCIKMYFYIFGSSLIGIKYDVCERIKVTSRCDLARAWLNLKQLFIN